MLAEYSPDNGGKIDAGPSKKNRRSSVNDLSLGDFAEKVYKARRDREVSNSYSELFHDPAWDILLDLFIAHAKGKYISVTDAGLAGQVPNTTALRWVWGLEKAGLVSRKPDPKDKRRCFVVLNKAGLSYMRPVLATIGERLKSPLFST